MAHAISALHCGDGRKSIDPLEVAVFAGILSKTIRLSSLFLLVPSYLPLSFLTGPSPFFLLGRCRPDRRRIAAALGAAGIHHPMCTRQRMLQRDAGRGSCRPQDWKPPWEGSAARR
jgi:hypothetical protein